MKKIKNLLKKAIAIVLPYTNKKIYGMKVFQYVGVPEGEIWIFTYLNFFFESGVGWWRRILSKPVGVRCHTI